MNDVFMNRELSWLKFNERVLEEAEDENTPLCERLSFVSIYQSNLDEFFMVRVGSLVDQDDVSPKMRENKTHMTAKEQIDAVIARVHELNGRRDAVYARLMEKLEEQGVRLVDFRKIGRQESERLERYFDSEIAPLISPSIVGRRQRGAELKLSIAAKWDDPLMPAWEICRVLANLIDNALDAATGAELPAGEKPTVELVLGEDLRSWFFSVRNNGPAIPEKARVKFFEPGFSTKKTGQGMGLFIVNQTVTEMGGRITVESHDGDTVFSGFVPRKRLKLGEGADESPKETPQTPDETRKYEENAQKDDNSINKSDENS